MTEVELSGVVGSDTFHRNLVFPALLEAGGGPVRIKIASEGGYGPEALAILELLAQYRGEIITEATHAGSAASMVMMAGRRRLLHADGWFWPHSSWGCAVGSVAQIERAAKAFAESERQVEECYLSAGIDAAELARIIALDRPLKAQDALKHGFVTEILPLPGHAPKPPIAEHRAIATLAFAASRLAQNPEPTSQRKAGVLANFHAMLKRLFKAGQPVTHLHGVRWKCPTCGKLNYNNPEPTPERPQPCAWCRARD